MNNEYPESGPESIRMDMDDEGEPHKTSVATTLVPRDPVRECLKETHAPDNQVALLLNGHWELANLPMIKRWMLCFLVKKGIMSEAGVLYQDAILRHIPEKEKPAIVKIIDRCLFKKKHLPYETAMRYLLCFHRTNAQLSRILNGI
ncbi:unnamed protein product [Leptidea sinapis]|uniref:Uncharacterized protein n=1 Tax=Leptidea sinapis TaxID=189913 RepID=A0A5E4Q7L6_9NEOP|nr:unnamed protein product [Leptidea sinapis]